MGLDTILDEKLSDFIESIFEKYTELFIRPNYKPRGDELPLIPLGFLPSLIISNWNLQAFDQNILNLLHPVYYGRYVDDMLLVFKSSEESKSFSNKDLELNIEDLINKYLLNKNEFINKESTIFKKENGELINIIDNGETVDIIKNGIKEEFTIIEKEDDEFFTILKKHTKNELNIISGKNGEEKFIVIRKGEESLKVLKKDKIEYGINNLHEIELLDRPHKVELNYEKDSEQKLMHYENLRIQKTKLKVFRFNHMQSRALLENFKAEIYRNSSEFRLMHEDEKIYSNISKNIFPINYSDTINKLSGIESMKVSKFELSKALSRLSRNSIYTTDSITNENIKILLDAFEGNKLLEFMILWEKLIEFLFIEEKYDILIKQVNEIYNKINDLNYEPVYDNNITYEYYGDTEKILKKSIKKFLYFSIIRAFSLKKDNKTENILKEIINNFEFTNIKKANLTIENFIKSYLYKNSLMADPLLYIDKKPIKLSKGYNLLKHEQFLKQKSFKEDENYYYKFYPRYVQFHEVILHEISKTLANNNKLGIGNYLRKSRKLYHQINGFLKNKHACRLDFKNEHDDLKRLEKNNPWQNHDNTYITLIKNIINEYDESKVNETQDKIEDIIKKHTDIAFSEVQEIINPYLDKIHEEENNSNIFEKESFYSLGCNVDNEICNSKCQSNPVADVDIINVGYEKKSEVKVGLINTRLNVSYFKEAVKGNRIRTSNRLDDISSIINEAILKKVEFLVMPELYMPFEWIPGLIDISRKHQMAMIFGVEPHIHKSTVGNYIAISLPSQRENKHKDCTLLIREKKAYSPEELLEYEKHHLKINENTKNKYILCTWNNICFIPYNCYEIADIEARSIFKSCCDIVTVSEYNKDTNYFSTIAESLSRDLFCYCIKANTSEYGGTSIIQPSITEQKYLVNIKGGHDDYVVTQTLNIQDLRKTQIKKYDPSEKTILKPKPPGFNHHIVRFKNNLPPRQ